MAAFKAFKPSGMEKIARSMGYTGNMNTFGDYLAQDPMRQNQMNEYTNRAIRMARGGLAMDAGGMVGQVGDVDTGGTGGGYYGGTGDGDYGGTAGTVQPSVQSMTPAGTGVQQGIQPIVTQNYNTAGKIAQADPSVKRERKPYVPPVIEGLVYEGFGEGKQRGGWGGGTGYKMPETGYTPAQMEAFRQMQKGTDGIYSNAAAEMHALKNKNAENERIKLGTQEAYLINQYKASRGNSPVNRQDYADYMGRYGFSVDPNTPPEGITYRPQRQVRVDTEMGAADTFVGTLGGPVYNDNGGLIGNLGAAGPLFGEPGGGMGAALGNYANNLGNAEPSPTNVSRTFTTGQDPVPIQTIQPLADGSAPTIGDVSAQRMQQPGLPVGGVAVAQGIAQTPGQIIDPTLGQVQGSVAAPITGATTSYAQAPIETQANVTQAVTAAPAVDSALNAVQAAQGAVSPEANVLAAQQAATSVGNVTAAQGNAILMDNPVQREIQEGELISGSADAQKAAQFTEQVQAAQATPSDKATIQGQLTELMGDFDDGKTPAWAAGAMRKATQAMAARGLGASSLAGQAVIQATMEAALPIAQADASVQAQFESQNLSNRQQRAILAAQQRAEFLNIEFTQDFQARVQNSARIADVANMNFTAEQQVALENSRVANTVNLNNLSNRQAVVMAEAAALAQMDMANLSNRQQAAVMNAQNFMQTDMANLSNRQQTETFKAQQRIQSLFTDQAATNAARQFNASSQNQTDQFFANLANNVSQFNTAQANGQAQFNAGQANVMEKFNAEINNQRDQFNAQNQVVIAQSNAQWRRQLATADTAAINRANEVNAQNVLNVSNQAYANMWQMYSDTMEWAWTSAENSQDRISAMAIAQVDATMRERVAGEQASSAAGVAIGGLIGQLGSAYIESKFKGKGTS